MAEKKGKIGAALPKEHGQDQEEDQGGGEKGEGVIFQNTKKGAAAVKGQEKSGQGDKVAE